MTSITAMEDAATSALESATLVTFFLNAVPMTHTVDLLGSWDNFSASYPMTKDSRKGRGHWRGIHSFQNIICDGDPSNVSTKRNGALRPGGLYWYYYRLNGHLEHHNPLEPSTTACPLLPGQRVNILEVPIELACPSLSEIELREVMTLNPKDRWAPLKRKRTLQTTFTSGIGHVEKKRKEYLGKALGRQSTAAGEMVILLSSGYRVPKSSAKDSMPTRAKSSSATSNPQKSFPQTASFNRFSHTSTSSTNSQDGTELKGDDSRRSREPGREQLALQQRTSEFLAIRRLPPSRPRTTMASLSKVDPMFDSPPSHVTRPLSAPKSIPCPKAGSANVNDQLSSPMLRVACAKLRTLQSDPRRSCSDNSWIMDELPETVSGVLSRFRLAKADAERKLKEPSKRSSMESSQSPPQLPICSRQSTIWTPDSASVNTAPPSDVWEASQRSSFRYSLQSAFTVYNEDSGDVQDCANKNGETGGGDVLGLQFSSLALGSQETIKPVRAFAVEPKPFDSEWNPFAPSVGVERERKPREAQDEAARGPTNNRNDMMNDLSFLSGAIA